MPEMKFIVMDIDNEVVVEVTNNLREAVELGTQRWKDERQKIRFSVFQLVCDI
jgi:hypothetical protein